MPRTTVASISTAAAMPTPRIFSSTSDRVAKIEKTATMISAALVTTPALEAMPPTTASRVEEAAGPQLADAAEDEHVVVHADPEQEHEHEQRHPGDDPAERGVAERPLQPPVLEDQRDQPVGGADRQQVQHDRDQRDGTDRNAHQQHEGQPGDEGEDDRAPGSAAGG